MPVRRATPTDELAIAVLCTSAFFDEELFGNTVHPYRHQYPGDVLPFWHARVRQFFSDPRSIIIVATVEEAGAEKIAGMATWQRQGDDKGALKIMQAWKDHALLPLPLVENRAIDPTKRTILQDAYPYFKHHWDATTNDIPRSQNWYLNLCAIDPAFQKRGIGQHLVAWGLERARQENVHASTISSFQNERFYLRCGFDNIVGNCCEGENNPLRIAGVKGGALLFMWAKKTCEETTQLPYPSRDFL
jgi:GNAT superfamily N-acetyltransferase